MRKVLGLFLVVFLAAAVVDAAPKRVLVVVTNHGSIGDSDSRTGYFLSEVAHPWKVFTDAGYGVTFASPEGGFAPMDPKSFDLSDPVNREFWETLDAVQGVTNTRALGEIDPKDYAAIFFSGGHGTMWDFPGSAPVQGVTASIYAKGGVVGAVCHGPAALVNVILPDGSYLVEGKKVAGFTNEEEEAVGLTSKMPFLLETKLRERGAEFIEAANFAKNVVADERLVTGQNPASAEATAEEMVRLLEADRGS